MLACEIGGRVFLPHHLQHTFRTIQLEKSAFLYQFNPRSVPAKDVSAHWRTPNDLGGCWPFCSDWFGDMHEEAVKDHGKNLEEFLQSCEARGIQLNSSKVNLRNTEVPFVGHMATDKGPWRCRPSRRCHRQLMWPVCNNCWAWCRSNTWQSSCLISQTSPSPWWTSPRRVWNGCGTSHRRKHLRSSLKYSCSPLAYEVTLQCDVFQFRFGALLQEGQPVAYILHALTDTDARYAKTEELLVFFFGYERFDDMHKSRDVVHIESDHQPL